MTANGNSYPQEEMNKIREDQYVGNERLYIYTFPLFSFKFL